MDGYWSVNLQGCCRSHEQLLGLIEVLLGFDGDEMEGEG